MAVAWSTSVNQDAYGLDIGGGDNVERVEFESGKSRTYLKNSVPKKVYSFVLSMEDVGPTSEFKAFVSWWEGVLMSGSLSFLFPNLLTHSGNGEYRAVGTYSVAGQKRKEVSMSVEEM